MKGSHAAQHQVVEIPQPKPGPPGPNYHKIMQRRAMWAKRQADAEHPQVIEVLPMARGARPKLRHWGLGLGFLFFVLLPTIGAWYYLKEYAAPQFESRVGFSVRTEETPIPGDLFGGLVGFSSASSSDTDVLYEFIQSPEMIARIDARLDLRTLYSKPSEDPVFALSGTSREDLISYWPRMLRLYYDPGTGLLEVRSFAFSPEDAQAVAKAVFEESSQMVNELSSVARADATRHAETELARAAERLSVARGALREFRNKTQIIDPTVDIAGQMGLLNTLQAQLADTMVEHDLLATTTRENDPRLDQTRRKIAAIETRIIEERQKLGLADGNGYAEVVGEFEKLQVDLEFAQASYLTAQAARDTALAEANRKTRYLAAYLHPTLAETATGPDKVLLIAMVAGFSFIAWAIATLVYYSLRDRR